MDVWNRGELYKEVWEEPLVKLAAKYGISAVMIGKVCRKLQIPLPGRGYWVKKEFGKHVDVRPLPQVEKLPVVQRFRQPISAEASQNSVTVPEPTDPEYLRILEIEVTPMQIDPQAKEHKLIRETAKNLRRARPDDRGILQCRYDQLCLDVRVSANVLQRALSILNFIVQALEAAGFPAELTEQHQTSFKVFGQRVRFVLVERTHEKSRQQVQETPSWTRTIIKYEPTGRLEFRVGEYPAKSIRDGKTRKLEDLLPNCLGALLREGRQRHMRAEQAKLDEIARQKKREEMAELSRQIEEEEVKVRNLNGWVDTWLRARQMREFITALEKVWIEAGHDLSVNAPKGQRIIWMKQQADRVDPMVDGPPSILDRKDELNKWW